MVAKEYCIGNTRIRIADNFVERDEKKIKDLLIRIMMISKSNTCSREGKRI